jgi:hypothetical protein
MKVEAAAFRVAAPRTEFIEEREHFRTSRGIAAPQIEKELLEANPEDSRL